MTLASRPLEEIAAAASTSLPQSSQASRTSPLSRLRRTAVAARVATAFGIAALVATVGLAPAAQGVTETAATRADRYITQVYGDLVGHAPDASSLLSWETALVGGTPRIAVANALTVGTEYRTGLVNNTYQHYLNRAADATGMTTWLSRIASGYTIQQMESGFTVSSEYYTGAGGTNRTWIAKLYVDIFGRTASSADLDFWTGQMARGVSRSRVATGFLMSAEHLGGVVDVQYQAFLNRALLDAERTTAVSAIQSGTRLETITSGIVGSDEYYAQSDAAPVYRTAAYDPWAVTAMSNTSVGSGAIYESKTSTMTAALLTGTPTINRDRWSISIALAKTTDPFVYLTDIGKTPNVVYKIYIPVGLEPTAGTDKHVGIIQPDGVTLYECYKYNKVDATHFTSTYVNINDLRGDGLQRGSRASGISFLIGLIRTHEMADKVIPHTIAIGTPASMMLSGPVWPARLQDNQVGTNIYTGVIPMGTMFAIPPSVDLTKLGLSAEGMALGHALQDYGGHVLVQSSTVALYTEPDADYDATNRMKADYQQKLFPLLRRLVNNTATNVSGGGTRLLTPAAPLG
ncbi:DUF4214 domain-containing protein [Pengzhenrongella sp.]|uniref:DUF4214 domain-containing protein n=1 Tax=Pengzhenrongella sp. TaxID=2888820 RepID=UPI002F94FF5A